MINSYIRDIKTPDHFYNMKVTEAEVSGSAEFANSAEQAENAVNAETADHANLTVNLGSGINKEVAADFMFRTSGGSSDISGIESGASAEITNVHGNTIVWNQLYTGTLISGFYTTASKTDNIWKITSKIDSTGAKVAKVCSTVIGHTYYLAATMRDIDSNGDSVTSNYPYLGILKNNGLTDGRTKDVEGGIKNKFVRSSGIATATSAYGVWFRIKNDALKDSAAEVKDIIVCDLTQMFGAGKEPATTEEFEAMFSRADYSYDAGSLLNFTGTGIKTVGFNLLGRTPIVTNSTNTGYAIVPLDRSVFAHVKAGVSYRIKVDATDGTVGRFVLSCYHEDGTKVTDVSEFGRTSSAVLYFKYDGVLVHSANTVARVVSFTPTVNMYLALNLNLEPSTGSYDPSTACIFAVWSGYRNNDYEPYWTSTLNLPISSYFSDGMKSVNMTYDELTNNKATQRIGKIILDGTEKWTLVDYSAPGYVYIPISEAGEDGCQCATLDVTEITSKTSALGICLIYSNTNKRYQIHCRLDDSMTVAKAKQYFTKHPTTIYYILAEPIETEISPILDLKYKVSDFGTEQLLPENGIIPTTTDFIGIIKYGRNLKDKLQRDLDINIDIATLEDMTDPLFAYHYDETSMSYIPFSSTLNGIKNVESTISQNHLQGTTQSALSADNWKPSFFAGPNYDILGSYSPYSEFSLAGIWYQETQGKISVWEWLKERINRGDFNMIHAGDFIPNMGSFWNSNLTAYSVFDETSLSEDVLKSLVGGRYDWDTSKDLMGADFLDFLLANTDIVDDKVCSARDWNSTGVTILGINTYKHLTGKNHIDFMFTSPFIDCRSRMQLTPLGDTYTRWNANPWLGSELYLYLNGLSGKVMDPQWLGTIETNPGIECDFGKNQAVWMDIDTPYDHKQKGFFYKLHPELQKYISPKFGFIQEFKKQDEEIVESYRFGNLGKIWIPTSYEANMSTDTLTGDKILYSDWNEDIQKIMKPMNMGQERYPIFKENDFSIYKNFFSRLSILMAHRPYAQNLLHMRFSCLDGAIPLQYENNGHFFYDDFASFHPCFRIEED